MEIVALKSGYDTRILNKEWRERGTQRIIVKEHPNNGLDEGSRENQGLEAER